MLHCHVTTLDAIILLFSEKDPPKTRHRRHCYQPVTDRQLHQRLEMAPGTENQPPHQPRSVLAKLFPTLHLFAAAGWALWGTWEQVWEQVCPHRRRQENRRRHAVGLLQPVRLACRKPPLFCAQELTACKARGWRTGASYVLKPFSVL